MIEKYNAFISYKHADLDNKVAAAIVKGLERYHIPGKIRKATGYKKIDRIFRDKDELPITNDLNDTITEALADSDYLIVICSTNTKKSTWVEKEIETFLKNHSMNHILTVLADGEPSEVIPQALLSEKKQVQDENGVYHTVEIPLEPLSCDFRLPKAKAKAEELPRLVAALIGCSYDELMNRHRQYKMRRLTAIFAGILALSVGFGLYMYRSNTLIQKNYLESLRNQSRYLANESSKQLDNENRIGAMQLALEALPKDETDPRPVTPEAVRAVTDSTLAYVSLQGSNVSAAWNYRMPNHIESFELTSDGATLVARDLTGVVEAWNTSTHEQILHVYGPEDKVKSFMLFGTDKLLVVRTRSLEAYDLSDGKLLWKNDSDDKIITNRGIYEYTDDSILLVGSDGVLEELSMTDGSLKKSIPVIVNSEESSLSISKTALSEDKTRLVYQTEELFGDVCILNEYNLNTNETISREWDKNYIRDLIYCNDNIYVSFPGSGLDGSAWYFDYNFVAEDHTDIYCLASGTLETKWEYDFACTDVSINAEFFPLGKDRIAYYAGNVSSIWDLETGELLAEHVLNDSIINISDNDGDGEPLYITRGGATASPVQGGMALIDRFTDNLTDARVKKGFYGLAYQSSEIIYYGVTVFDESWTGLGEMPFYNPDGDVYYMDEDNLFVLAADGDGTKLITVNLNEKKYAGEFNVSTDIKPSGMTVLGKRDNILYLAACSGNSFELYEINLSSREISNEVLNENYYTYEPVCAMQGDKLVYFNNDGYTESMLIVRNLADGTETEFDMPYQRATGIAFSNEANLVYIMGAEDLIIDLESENMSTVDLPETWNETITVAIDESGEYLVSTDSQTIRVIGKDGELIYELSCENVYPLAMDIHRIADGQKVLLVAYNNGTLARYKAETGESLGRSDLSTYSSTFYNGSFKYDDEEHLIYFKMEDVLDVIETDSWVELACISDCYGYQKATDTFWTVSYREKRSESQIGYFSHYSVEDLIEKAKDLLGGTEMTEEQKAFYGIN